MATLLQAQGTRSVADNKATAHSKAEAVVCFRLIQGLLLGRRGQVAERTTAEKPRNESRKLHIEPSSSRKTARIVE